jgi:Nif-specific regulatory protein
MNPRLVVIAGPSKGAVFDLVEDEVPIGRDPANQVCLGDLLVSRRHCLVTRDAERFKISDLQSHNGTFVNDVPVNERMLEAGDRIRVGDSLLLFLLDEDESQPTAEPTSLDEEAFAIRSTIRLRREEAVYLHPEKLSEALPASARMARDLSALMKISTVINSIRDVAALKQQLLELIFEFVPAERGALLLTELHSEAISSVVARHRAPTSDQPVRLSRTIVRQVLQEGVAVLGQDVFGNETLSATESLLASRTTSLLCVPLTVCEKVLGVIYLDTTDSTIQFDEGDLQLMTAVAGLAAVALENARHVERLHGETRRLRADLAIEHDMVGESLRMRQVYELIAKVAPSDSTILIRGESGTGKELAARAIHQNSPRANNPFVAINGAALTEALLESELFGHEKGAFTGAVAQKKGKLEVADGGTVFLDEVGEMPPTLQVKLLRVLQERGFERVGGMRPIKVDIRLVAATNRDLPQAIRDGRFREELYYRLNVVSLAMPPLRERREDVPLLAGFFAAKHGRKLKRRMLGISPEARDGLMKYSWLGNVRELENAIERAVVLGSTEWILPEDLPETVLEAEATSDVPAVRYYERLNELKKQLVTDALDQAGGNYTDAAKLLGMHPNNLHRLMRSLNLKAEAEK